MHRPGAEVRGRPPFLKKTARKDREMDYSALFAGETMALGYH